MKRLELSLNNRPVAIDYKLNEFNTGDIYHVIVRTPEFAAEVGKDHFFKICREGTEMKNLEFSILSPDHPKNSFRIFVANHLIQLAMADHRPEESTKG